jgi:hypothetical protein
LLPENARRHAIQDIEQSGFPEPGDLPTVDQLLSTSRNTKLLVDPPPTKDYPRLKTSSWDSTYFTDQHKRVRARVSFSGNRGRYITKADGQTLVGTLDQVRYRISEQGLFLIAGRWHLDGGEGYFRFAIAPDNLNLFEGEWGQNGGIKGIWAGTRVRE